MSESPAWLEAHLADILEWVEEAYPEEGCGLVLADGAGNTRWMKCENLANKYHELDPESYPRTAETFYIINPLEFVKADDRGEEVKVVVHSHADVGDYFSEEDVAAATMPSQPGEPVEAAHPGVDYLVVSVREGAADFASLFRFEPGAGDFELKYRGAISRPELALEPTDPPLRART